MLRTWHRSACKQTPQCSSALSQTWDIRFYWATANQIDHHRIGPVWIYPTTCKTVANKGTFFTVVGPYATPPLRCYRYTLAHRRS